MRTATRFATTALMALVVAGCSLFPDPQTPKQMVATCYASVSAGASATTLRLEADLISTTTASEVLAVLEHAQNICGIGRVAATGNRPTDAIAYIDAALLVLNTVEELINERN